ncbi:MAG TPA: TrkA C-terminal domain-containing protein [Bacillota bacterium]|jgi:hypothetical protein|nr:TrkA C-terminal domain-containing protein [Bacillota bacterium]HOL09386.1 TrkA C-terminal domain-containing protein [Bacillota bacterium]HPO97065.1 TrkA C-terminal domain-containing protein [Bacillota bacterium]
MSISEKIALIILANVISVLIIMIKLILEGKRFMEVLKYTWDLILIDPKSNILLKHRFREKWLLVQHYCWWLMLFFVVYYWLFIPNASSFYLITLVIVHLLWGLIVKLEPKYNRIINLNQNWGIIFQEITEDSWFNKKSLAELDLRKKSLLVLAIERQGQMLPFPKGVEVLMLGDRVAIFGDLNYYKGLLENLDISR